MLKLYPIVGRNDKKEKEKRSLGIFCRKFGLEEKNLYDIRSQVFHLKRDSQVSNKFIFILFLVFIFVVLFFILFILDVR